MNKFSSIDFNLYTAGWVYTGEDLNKNGNLDEREDINNNDKLDIFLHNNNRAVKGSLDTPRNLTTQDNVTISVKLTVFDENAKININYVCNKPYTDVSNKTLARILGVLGEKINVKHLAEKILSNRTGCFTLIGQMKHIVVTILNY